jgi:hypothetical protein
MASQAHDSSGPAMALFSSSLTTTVIIGFLGLIYLFYVREATPLRKVPGPLVASFSKLWMVHKTRQLKRHEIDLELHKKYGPVVRIGPTYVSVSSPSALKQIYGTFRLMLLPSLLLNLPVAN